MYTIEFKRELIHFCIIQLQKKEAVIQMELDETMKIANDYGPQKDRYDGFRNQQMSKIERLTAQIHIIQADIRVFLQIDLSASSSNIKLGSLFTTDDQSILVATSMGKIEFKDIFIFVISPKVPLYESLRGFKVGNKAQFRDREIEIKSIV